MANGTYDPQKHHRRSIRLKGYDYSQPGAYFFTICTYNRELILGEISDGETSLNECGRIVLACWHNLTNFHSHVELDAFIVMPNHVHGIVVIKSAVTPRELIKPIKRYPLSEVVRVFKTSSSRRINNVRGSVGTPIWQRNYWEHVVRNEEGLNKAREYIIYNPLKWVLDRENPANVRT